MSDRLLVEMNFMAIGLNIGGVIFCLTPFGTKVGMICHMIALPICAFAIYKLKKIEVTQ